MASNSSEAAEAASPGMPQLDFSSFGNQIFWLVVTLVVIYVILSRVALPRIADVLAERRESISNDIAAAEDLKLKAGEAEVAYHKALAAARAAASNIVEAAKAEIKVELAAAIAKADGEISDKVAEGEKVIQEIRKDALASVEDIAKITASALIGALGGKDDAPSVAKAVSSEMKG
jgi:F-type H+-transporting ATPase subunit b